MNDAELVVVLSEPEDRQSRLRLVGWDPAILKNAKIFVAGAGALGNEVIKNLALLGVGTIIITDFDTIEVTNLSRSVLFRESDIGRPKAEVAALRAKELNPAIEVYWFHGDLETELGTGVFRRVHVVLGCLDNRAARLALNRHCRLANTPWVDGALDGLNGLVRMFAGGQGPCYECTLTEADYTDLRRRFSCQGLLRTKMYEGLIPTTPTSASLIAAMQVEMAVCLLHQLDVPFGQELIYSSALHEIVNVRLNEQAECLSHELAEPIKELVWARAQQTSFRQLLDEAQKMLGTGAALELDREIVTQMVCPICETHEERVISANRLTEREVQCGRCGQERTLRSVHRIDQTIGFLEMDLQTVGIPAGHIIRARKNEEYCYLELSGDFPTTFGLQQVVNKN